MPCAQLSRGPRESHAGEEGQAWRGLSVAVTGRSIPAKVTVVPVVARALLVTASPLKPQDTGSWHLPSRHGVTTGAEWQVQDVDRARGQSPSQQQQGANGAAVRARRGGLIDAHWHRSDADGRRLCGFASNSRMKSPSRGPSSGTSRGGRGQHAEHSLDIRHAHRLWVLQGPGPASE